MITHGSIPPTEDAATYGAMTSAELEQVVVQAAQAAAAWGSVPVGARLEALTRLAAELRAPKDGLAAMITAEMGADRRGRG